MPKKNIVPQNALEEAVLNKVNGIIVYLIANGAQLSRPDILAGREAFNLYYPVAVLLLESSPCLRQPEAVKRLEELEAHPEMIDLVREIALPLPENTHPQSAELLAALREGNEAAALNLIVTKEVTLESAAPETFEHISGFSELAVETLLDHGLAPRLQARLFFELRKKESPLQELLFEIMKEVIREPASAERKKRIHRVWENCTASAFAKTIEADPDKYSDEFLADMIINREVDLAVRPFTAFAPYYQVLMLNNGRVDVFQFAKEAEIEKYDAKAVFELLSFSYEHADRVNWELVNKTAKASEFLRFLAEHPRFAEQADWQMLNVHGSAADWLAFLEMQPKFLIKCQDHTRLYTADPDLWTKIFSYSSLPFAGVFACLEKNPVYEEEGGVPWKCSCKIIACSDEPRFFEVNAPDTCEQLEQMAEDVLFSFADMLAEGGTDTTRFVKIIR